MQTIAGIQPAVFCQMDSVNWDPTFTPHHAGIVRALVVSGMSLPSLKTELFICAKSCLDPSLRHGAQQGVVPLSGCRDMDLT